MSPTLVGLELTCVCVCLLVATVNPAEQSTEHVLLKQNVDSSGCSDYECKHYVRGFADCEGQYMK